MNWEKVRNEMEVIDWVTDYLDLHDRQYIAVLIVKEMFEKGALSISMEEVMRAVLTMEEGDEEERDVE